MYRLRPATLHCTTIIIIIISFFDSFIISWHCFYAFKKNNFCTCWWFPFKILSVSTLADIFYIMGIRYPGPGSLQWPLMYLPSTHNPHISLLWGWTQTGALKYNLLLVSRSKIYSIPVYPVLQTRIGFKFQLWCKNCGHLSQLSTPHSTTCVCILCGKRGTSTQHPEFKASDT